MYTTDYACIQSPFSLELWTIDLPATINHHGERIYKMNESKGKQLSISPCTLQKKKNK